MLVTLLPFWLKLSLCFCKWDAQVPSHEHYPFRPRDGGQGDRKWCARGSCTTKANRHHFTSGASWRGEGGGSSYDYSTPYTYIAFINHYLRSITFVGRA